ncbi:MAG: 50S ribosomal protein L4 [Cytophagaceae bacterium]|jgi:large subunit ribosomal protein L4|nr:50S ribosomal protein L4 [Cytophagaceae bacterium]
MELNVVNIQGKETGRKIELSDSIFAIEPNDHAIYLDVKQYLANQRQGTHKSKERGEVAGSTRKIKKQKGTGTARAGSLKSPVFRGGGRAFGPQPRDYSFKLNKKLKQLARLSALTYKAQKNAIIVVEDFSFEVPKTKEFAIIRKNLQIDGSHSMVVLKERNTNIYLSSRNVPKSEIVIPSDMNTYSIMRAKSLVLTESSVAELNQFFNV